MRTSAATVILALLAIILGSLSAIQLSQSNLYSIFGRPPLGAGDFLFDFDPAKIARLRITTSTGTTATFHWENKHWRMKTPFDDRADYRHLQSLVLATRSLRVEDAIPRGELSPEQAGFGAGHYEIALTNTSGAQVAHYHLGRQTPWHRVTGEQGQLAETFFVRPADGPEHVYICSGANARPLLDSGFDTLRDHRPFLFNAADLAEVKIHDKNDELVVARDSQTGAWRITKPLELRTNAEAISSLARDLYQLEALAAHDPGAVTIPARTGDEAYLEISLGFFNKKGEPFAGPVLTIEAPATEDAKTVFARVSNRDTVFELPLNSSNGHTALVNIPISIDALRSTTLCSLDITTLKSATIHAPSLDVPLVLSLGREIISGKPRWMIDQGSVRQPANEAAVARLFTAIAIDNVTGFATDGADDLKPFGLDPPAKSLVLDVGGEEPIELLFGTTTEGKYFAMRRGTPTVAEIDYGTYSRVPVAPFSWRDSILWPFSIVDLAELRIERPGEHPLDLTYNFISEKWTAQRKGADVTRLLNVQRANILANKLEELQVTRWLGPEAREAALRLEHPSLIIDAAYRATDEEGNPTGTRHSVITLVPASLSPRNQLFFGRLSGSLDYFLIDKDSYEHIDVRILEN